MKKIMSLFLGLSLMACANAKKQAYLHKLKAPKLMKDKAIELGGLSGLHSSKAESSRETLIFYSLTDRGPNGKKRLIQGGLLSERPFLAPQFSPEILRFSFSLKTKELKLLKRLSLKGPQGQKLSGLPNVAWREQSFIYDEKPVTQKNKALDYDPRGIDPESIVRDKEGFFWVGEEYGPSLLKISPQGKLLKRWFPQNNSKKRWGEASLPAVFSKRKLNGGFEAIVIQGEKLYAFLQSPIPQATKKYARVLEWDLKLEQATGVYLYPFHEKGKKIGGASLREDGSLAILEQNGDLYFAALQKIYGLDLSQATNLITDTTLYEVHPELMKEKGIKPLLKTELMDLTQYGLNQFEKVEGLSFIQGSTFLVNDNDFNVEALMGQTSETSPSFLIEIKSQGPKDL